MLVKKKKKLLTKMFVIYSVRKSRNLGQKYRREFFFKWTNKANTNGTDRKFTLTFLKFYFITRRLYFIKKKKNLQSLINVMCSTHKLLPECEKKSYHSCCEWVKMIFLRTFFLWKKIRWVNRRTISDVLYEKNEKPYNFNNSIFSSLSWLVFKENILWGCHHYDVRTSYFGDQF